MLSAHAQTPAGRLRAYYRDAWGIDTLRHSPTQVRVRRSLRLSGLGWNRGRYPASPLGFIDISAPTLVGIVAGGAAMWIWMRSRARS